MRRALSELVVVEVAQGIAGSYCGKLFADLGADVVKVEGPAGDELRHRGEAPEDASGLFRGGAFLHLSTNKRSAVLDQSSQADRGTFARLAERADLVIESTGGGSLDSWGLGWEELHERAPRLSVVKISGFGATGPYASYVWDDIVVQAVSGALLLQNSPDQDPLRLPGNLVLHFVGHVAALGALSALLLAGAGCGGSFVDCSAVEALATLPARQAPLLAFEYRGRGPLPAELMSTGTSTLIPTGVYPCGDGYVAMMSTPQQLQEMLKVLDDPAATAAFADPDAFQRTETKEVLDVAVYTWLAARTRAEATKAAQEAGWPLAGVNLAEEVLAADHLHQRNFWVHTDDTAAGSVDLPGPWCRFGEGGWSLRRLAPDLGERDANVATDQVGDGEIDGDPDAPPALADPVPARPPLEGIRIVDLTTVWAGPYATMLLADLGAEVIRVENPFVLPPTTKGYHPRPTITNPGFLGSLYGRPAPGAPDRPWNRHAMNNSLARNKLSVTIDLRREEGRELLMRLADKSDVFVDNFKTSGLDHIGIDVSELQRRNPSLIVVRMPPTGLTGDWSGYTGFGAQFDGLTGLLSLCGHRDSDLTTSPATTYMDGASGPAGAFAVLAALRYRAKNGRGQFVELSQSENIINHLGDVYVDYQLGVEPNRRGNRDRWRAPQGLYRCQGVNRWIAISVGDDPTWRALTATIGRPELALDPRFSDPASRRAHHDEVDDIVSEWASKQEPLQAFHALQGSGVPAGPLLDDQMFVDDPQIRHRDWMQPLSSADVGTHLHPGFAFAGVPQVWRRGSPTLGEDNEYVYKKILGVTDLDYERYGRDLILATDYLTPEGRPY
jgi:crotonobetainyl-CoA:carnitine CoA-transferase CaiB-like acyl-CoA transferase